MSFQVDTALVQTYKSNIEIQFQQKGSRLRPYVRVESQNAEFDFYDRIGAVDAVENTGRHQDTPLVSTPHDRRRVHLRDFDWADLVDKKDKLRMLADPTSSYTQNAVWALGRRMDDCIIESAFGIAYTGKTGTTAVQFDAANQDVAANYVESGGPVASNLTIGKLRRARFLLTRKDQLDDDMEMLYMAVTASQIDALLRTTEVTSADYNTVKALAAGAIDTFMGFKFIRLERLPKTGNDRSCLAWSTGGLLLAVADEVNVDVGPRRDKRNSTQIYVCGSYNASRMWEEKVVRVFCTEA
jgi:hypothetical protein